MNHRLAFFLVIALVGSFCMSGFVHAIVPHTHAHGTEVLANSMHAALRAEQKIIPLASVILWILVALLTLESVTISSAVREPSRLQLQLYRGIEKYRRFR